jgi:hypothetical protein
MSDTTKAHQESDDAYNILGDTDSYMDEEENLTPEDLLNEDENDGVDIDFNEHTIDISENSNVMDISELDEIEVHFGVKQPENEQDSDSLFQDDIHGDMLDIDINDEMFDDESIEQNEQSNDIDALASSSVSASAEPQVNEEPQPNGISKKSIKEQKKKPSYLKIAIGLVIAIMMMGGALFLLQTLGEREARSQASVEKVRSVMPNENKRSLVSQTLPDTIEPKDENLFNGLAGEDKSIDKSVDYANTDETTKSIIERLQTEVESKDATILALNEEVRAKEISLSRLRQDSADIKDEIAKANTSIRNMKTDLESVRKELNDEHKSRLDAEANRDKAIDDLDLEKLASATLNEKLSLTEKELDRERSRVERLVTADSDGYANVVKQLEGLKADFNTKLQVKQATKVEKMLSQLKLVSVDPSAGQGVFLKIKDGRAVGEITLTVGETLVGRGKVSAIDSYGCVYFEDDKHYEPINGFCQQGG